MKNITYINAGAGSGKTTELTKTLAQLLKEGECKPSEVILTTFTEAAAAEFRQKARAKLYENNMPEVASQFAAATIG
ncbi:MAG: UvrD-helicase domain-containing protein, partial [Muribaculaceae bacterium]|nr:UvrD-helicase domain-containing protein [Muribaculaceae bacterium]